MSSKITGHVSVGSENGIMIRTAKSAKHSPSVVAKATEIDSARKVNVKLFVSFKTSPH